LGRTLQGAVRCGPPVRPVSLFSSPVSMLSSRKFVTTSKKDEENFDLMVSLKKNTNFGISELEALLKKFKKKSGANKMSRIEFDSCMKDLGITNPIMRERTFSLFDTHSNEHIDFREFVSGLSTLIRGTEEQRYQFIFKMWDFDGDGMLSKREFCDYLKSTIQPYSSVLNKEAMEEIVSRTFDEIDSNHSGFIDFEEFKKGIVKQQIANPDACIRFKVDQVSQSPAASDLLTLLGTRHKVAKGEKLIKGGDPLTEIYFVNDGEFSLQKEGDELMKIPRGEYVGEKSLFGTKSSGAHTLDVVASTDATVTCVEVSDLKNLIYHAHPGATSLMSELGNLMMKRMNFLDDILAERSKEDPATVQALMDAKHQLMGEWALHYHSIGKKGKLEVKSSKKIGGAEDLSVAYSPGVAEPCMMIKNNPDLAYEFTTKGHLVGVISNGTAVLGLGNIGAAASKPVMEGKAVLFKQFGGLDAFDIEINEQDPDKFIEHVVALEPTFGGINIEDVKSPECFRIEREIQARMNIPVMHDDQHGTAIIAGAGLLNALDLVGKDIKDVKVCVSGVGAAGFTCAKYFMSLGVKKENVLCVDINGVIYEGREDLRDPENYLHEVATKTDKRTLAEAVDGADVFMGVSVGGLLKPEMLKTMKRDPLVFAMANPVPEISYETALKHRPDVIMATGRSDYPNQINNCTAFPYIFRGALDCQARAINEEIKQAASKAIALLARTPDPAFSPQEFGREHIIPKPFDSRLLVEVSSAVVQAAMDSGVARKELDIDVYRQELAEDKINSK